MAFTSEEINRIANASLDAWRDGLTPMQRSRQKVVDARHALHLAQEALDEALAYRKEVHAMPYAQRHTVDRPRPEGYVSFKDRILASPRS
jgi:hypothetical protein